ncbi:MAG TPA: MATE family efflux transporter [Victivallales bacterium]|nr:MATE family efflux transporter [Victivallales bacterium]HRR06321.1 MATE family efflux transporter [Victivallales bacterium]
MRLKYYIQKNFEGDGGIKQLWAIAYPMILSSGFETFVMFLNRLMLSKVSPIQMAAMLNAGLTCFTMMTFFLGLIGYSSAITAHLYGAGRKNDCAKMTFQSLLLSMLSYPIIIALIPLGYMSFKIANHSPVQLDIEKEYFFISMIVISFFTLLKTPFASFFSGIGRTNKIMTANFVGLAINLIFAYLLIFGKFGLPRLEIRGAAIAIALSTFANFATLLFFYLREENVLEFNIRESFKFDSNLMKKLIRFGFPSGLEFLINMSAFTSMVSMFHGYGEIVASAVTIAFSWDMVSFVPMVGLQVAVMTLVGQNIGRKNLAAAIRSAYSGMKIVIFYSGTMLLLFLFIPSLLAEIFRPERCEYWEEIRNYAIPMVMMMSVYPISDGFLIVFSGAIRGAGDTSWAMFASAILHWSAALITWIVVKELALQPLFSWGIFVLCFPFFGLTFFLRFLSGKWKDKKVLANE